MRRYFVFFVLACVCHFALLGFAVPAQAEIFIAVNKSAQSMSVVVDGRERYRWPVSTGRDGGPPSGHYQPERLERTGARRGSYVTVARRYTCAKNSRTRAGLCPARR